MKKRFFIYSITFLTLMWLSVVCFGCVETTAPLAITHSMQTYSSDGHTMTVTLDLEIQSNGVSDMNEITIAPTTLRNIRFPPIDETEVLSIGSLIAGETVFITYILTSYIIYPEAWIENIPIFWEVIYFGETDQEVIAIIASRSTTR